MADRINIKIGLDGGQQVEQQLTDIGKAGEDSFKQIEQAADDVDFKKIADSSGKAAEEVKKIGDAAAQTSDGFKSASEATDTLAKSQAQLSEAVDKVDFEQIAANAEKITEALQQLGEQLGKISEQFAKLGATTSQLNITFGEAHEKSKSFLSTIGEFAHEASSAIAVFETFKAVSGHFGDLAGAAKTAGESLKGFAGAAEVASAGAKTVGTELVAAGAAGVSVLPKLSTAIEGIGSAMSFLALAINPVTIAIGALAAAGAGLTIVLNKMEESAKAAVEPWAKLSNSLGTLSLNSKISFDALQRGRAIFEQFGLTGEQFAATITKISEAIKDLDVGKSLQESADKSDAAVRKTLQAEKALLESQIESGNATNELANLRRIAAIEAIQEIDKQRDAEKALADARKQQAEAAANDLNKVLDQVEAIADGVKGVTFDPLVKADTIIKAFNLSLKEAADNGELVSNVFLNFIRNANRLQAVQVGKAFGFSDEDIDRIRRAEISVAELNQRLLQVGVAISPEAKKRIDEMNVATEATNRAWDRLQQAWESSVFAETAASTITKIEEIKAAFINLAATVLEAMTFEKLKLRLSQTLDAIKAMWFAAWESMALAAAAVLGKVGAKETAESLRQVAEGFHKSLEDAANSFADAQEKIDKTTGNTMIARLREAKQRTDETTDSTDKLSKKEQEVADKIANIRTTGLDKIHEAAQRAAEKIADLDKQISNVFASTRQEGLGKGIIDPATFGPVAGMEEAFEALMQKQARQVSDLEDKKKKAQQEELDREAEITAQIQEQVNKELQKLGVIKDQTAELQRLQQAQTTKPTPTQPGDQVPRAGETAAEFAARTGAVTGATAPPVFDQVTQAFQQMLSALDPVKQAFTQMSPVLDPVTQAFTRLAPTLDPITTSFQNMSPVLDQVTEALKKIAQQAQPATGGETITGNALGGLLGGRSGTDTNLGWFTAGEFVMRRDAVRQWGVEFMHAINAGRNPFAGTIPKFAEGGLASGGANVSIHFPGLPPIGGLRASVDTVAELQRAAAMAQVRSGGRKPSRYS